MHRLWDWPVRLCHAFLIIGMVAAWITHEWDAMVWHSRIGIMLLGVVIFRLLWGLVGSTTARFSHFLKSPAAVIHYIRHWRHQPRWLGHNPLGGWAVLALLLSVLVQASTGLFSLSENVFTDQFEPFTGPLQHHITEQWAKRITDVHENWFEFVLIPLISIHVLANGAYYFFKKQNLFSAMVHGKAPMAPDAALAFAPLRSFLLCLGLTCALLWGLLR